LLYGFDYFLQRTHDLLSAVFTIAVSGRPEEIDLQAEVQQVVCFRRRAESDVEKSQIVAAAPACRSFSDIGGN
jgi:hypothetical protein